MQQNKQEDMIPVTFRGRPLIKVILVLLVLVWAGLGCLVITQWPSEDSELAPLLWIIGLPFSVIGIFLLWQVNKAFSRLTIGSENVTISKVVGEKVVSWLDVAKVKFYVVKERSPYGGASVEPFLLLLDEQERKLLLLKSTYDAASYAVLAEVAAQKGIAVETGEPYVA